MIESQKQIAGDHSHNFQAKSIFVTQGLSLAEARQLFRDLFEQNFFKLAGIAAETAEKRASELVDRFLSELARTSPETIKSASDPAIQYALLGAQKDFARSGDPALEDILVDILVDRAGQPERNLRQIALDETLSVAPKLTAAQWDALSLLFVLRHTRNQELADLSRMARYLNEQVGPFVATCPTGEATFQHLAYAGCVTISMGAARIEHIFRKNYPGLFSKGFMKDKVGERLGAASALDSLLIPCLHETGLFQVRALDDDCLRTIATQAGFGTERVNEIVSLQNEHLMDDTEINAFLCKTSPVMPPLFDKWEKSQLKHCTLTSVGITLGHANFRRKTRQNPDLSIWMSE